MLEAVLVGAVRGGTSILYAALGETISERAGVINLGVEGCMLVGALGAYATAVSTGSLALGLVVAVTGGMALAAVHAFVVLERHANQLAAGLGVWLLGLGLTSLLGQSYVGRGVDGFANVPVPGLHRLPFVGPVLFDHDLLTYASFLAAPVVWWLLFRTRTGLALRAAGERDEVLHAYGRSPKRLRYLAVLSCGGLAGLGGAQLATALAQNWSENMTVGRGFVAVGLVIFAAWDPRRAVAGAYLFSGAVALNLQLQARGAGISPFLLTALPYLLVIGVLALFARRRVHAVPEGLRKVFESGAVS